MPKETKKKSEEIGILGLSNISTLEADILNIVWEKGQVSVREVHEIMLKKEISKKKKDFIPYTTVMSTMNFLSGKGLLKQDRSSKTYLYSATISRSQLAKNIIKTIAEKILKDEDSKTVDNFLKDNEDITANKVSKIIDGIK